jgi:hypothetical protein
LRRASNIEYSFDTLARPFGIGKSIAPTSVGGCEART